MAQIAANATVRLERQIRAPNGNVAKFGNLPDTPGRSLAELKECDP